MVLRETETHRRIPCVVGDRDWSDLSRSQRTPSIDDCYHKFSFPGNSDGKESVCKAGDPGSIPRLGRSPGEGNGYPLQYFCLEKLEKVKEGMFSRAFGRCMGNLTP